MTLLTRIKSPIASVRVQARKELKMNERLRAELAELTQFAAAEANDSAPPIRPMSVSGRADLGSSGGGESRVLGRAEISKHGQPRWPGAHGLDASGNPAKLGAPIKRVEGPHTAELEGSCSAMPKAEAHIASERASPPVRRWWNSGALA
jgi:hypothetical protein